MGVDSALLLKHAPPKRRSTAGAYAQLSWASGSGGGYTAYFGMSYWGDTIKFGASYPTWDGTKYADIISDVDIATVGVWTVGFRPTLCRITIDLSTTTGFIQDVAVTVAGIAGPYTEPVLGVNHIIIDLSALSIDIDSISFSWRHAAPTYSITNIEFFVTGGGVGSGNVEFAISARALNDTADQALAFGTAVVISDTGGTANTRYITPQSTAITPSGTPAKGADVEFLITHKGSTDGLTADACLKSVRLFYPADAFNDD
jgi:hypothetical protein